MMDGQFIQVTPNAGGPVQLASRNDFDGVRRAAALIPSRGPALAIGDRIATLLTEVGRRFPDDEPRLLVWDVAQGGTPDTRLVFFHGLTTDQAVRLLQEANDNSQ